MSLFNLDAPADKAVDYEYRGIVFKLKAIPDISGWHKSITEVLTRQDIDQKDIENGRLDNAEAFAGMAMVGTMVVGCDLQSIPDADGMEHPFAFDGAITHDIYETQGQALIGDSPVLQDHLYAYCMKLSKSPPDYEVRALGKSSKLSGSGDSETKKET